jgi:hypothetical protein
LSIARVKKREASIMKRGRVASPPLNSSEDEEDPKRTRSRVPTKRTREPSVDEEEDEEDPKRMRSRVPTKRTREPSVDEEEEEYAPAPKRGGLPPIPNFSLSEIQQQPKKRPRELTVDVEEPYFEEDYEDIYRYVPDSPDGVVEVDDDGVEFDEIVLDSVSMAHQSVLDYYLQQEAIKKTQLAPKKRHKRVRAQKIGDGVLKGSIRIDRIRSLLNDAFVDDLGKPIRRSEPQHTVHEAYIRACLPKIYDEEWDDNREAIMQKFEINRLQMWVLVVMARREGKTWGMAMFIAAMILSIPDTEISIFATCKRTAGKLLKVFHKFLMKAIAHLGDEEWVIVSKNAEQIIVMGPDGTERIIGCYPASVR